MLAAIGDTPYNIILFLHVLTAFVAMSPLFTLAVLARNSRTAGWTDRPAMFGLMSRYSMRIYGNALVISGLLGFGVAGLSDKVYSMSDPWLAAAFLLWIAMNGVLHALIRPSERAIAAAQTGDPAAESKLQLGGMLLTVFFVVMLYLMVFTPGA